MAIFGQMRSTFQPCLPTRGTAVPATDAWLHEVKYDGYRLIVQREGNRVRLITRGGYDWASRFPWISVVSWPSSAGTSMTVAGNLAFQSGAQYLVFLNSVLQR